MKKTFYCAAALTLSLTLAMGWVRAADFDMDMIDAEFSVETEETDLPSDIDGTEENIGNSDGEETVTEDPQVEETERTDETDESVTEKAEDKKEESAAEDAEDEGGETPDEKIEDGAETAGEEETEGEEAAEDVLLEEELMPLDMEEEPLVYLGDDGNPNLWDIDWSRTPENRDSVYVADGFGKKNMAPMTGALEQVYSGAILTELEPDSETSPVWDAYTDNQNYKGFTKTAGKDAVRIAGATWRNYSGVSLRRIQGTFTIPEGTSLLDCTLRLVSVAQPIYMADGPTANSGQVVAVNDNIYAFVYKQGEEINGDNYLKYLAFYAGHDIDEELGGVTKVTGKQCVAKYRKNTIISDQWIIHSNVDNLGATLARCYGVNTLYDDVYVVDLFLEDNSSNSGGGMDKLMLEYVHADATTAAVRVEYYQDSVSEDKLLGYDVFKSQTIGSSWNNNKVELDLYRPDGYKAGQIVNAPILTVSEDAEKNVIQVVYTAAEPTPSESPSQEPSESPSQEPSESPSQEPATPPSGGDDDDRPSPPSPKPAPVPEPSPEAAPPAQGEEEIEIVDEEIPLADGPQEDESMELADGDVPLADLPKEIPVEEIVIVDDPIALGDLPQTGTTAQPGHGLAAALLSAAGVLALAGVSLLRKRE